MTTVKRWRGSCFEDFPPGAVFQHHWGRTLLLSESIAYATRTLQCTPLYFDAEYARRLGYAAIPIHPLLVYSTVLGLSVEDLSEAGGPFLGVEDLVFGATVYDGDTVTATSTVLDRKVSQSRPGWGVVEWHTIGRNQRDEQVLDYRRTNLSKMQDRP